MRLGVIPVPIPNTMVKPQAADGTTPQGVGEQVAAGAPFRRRDRRDRTQEPRRGHPGAQAWRLAGGGVVRAHPSPSAAGAASCTLKTEY